jgi:hypothetical protein
MLPALVPPAPPKRLVIMQGEKGKSNFTYI